MSDFSSWAYTSKVTFWPVTRDEWDQITFGSPVTFDCDWSQGGKLTRDDTGQEFVPQSTVWIDAAPSNAPRRGWRMMVGEHTGSPAATAETVRAVHSWNPETFSEGLADFAIMTG